MDEFVNQFFGSSWTDDKASESLSWVGSGLDLTNGLLTDTMEQYKGDEKTLPSNLIPSSSHIVDSLITDGPSMFVGGNSSFDLDQTLVSRDSQPQQGDIDNHNKSSLPSLMDGNLNPVYMDRQMKAPSTLGIQNYGSPVALDPAKSLSAQPESVSVVMVQDKLQDFALQGQYVQTNDAVTGNNDFTDDNVLQGNLPALLSKNGQHKLNGEYLSSFTAGDHIPLGRIADMHPQMQLSEGNYIKHYADRSQISQLPHSPAVGSYNGTVKPRVRARRGQATDPHSIAERLRRERIAERMKKLQELVPKSNKIDRASMLDEIIDYVKFLQLQVKVLSMSRLGAAEAVLPLITDSQAEGHGGLILGGQCVDEAAFEQEVLKLMESNMMIAIHFLESTGMCLMPIALAEAIRSSKASSTQGTNGLVHRKNSQLAGLVYSASEARSMENIIGILGREDIPSSLAKR